MLFLWGGLSFFNHIAWATSIVNILAYACILMIQCEQSKMIMIRAFGSCRLSHGFPLPLHSLVLLPYKCYLDGKICCFDWHPYAYMSPACNCHTREVWGTYGRHLGGRYGIRSFWLFFRVGAFARCLDCEYRKFYRKATPPYDFDASLTSLPPS